MDIYGSLLRQLISLVFTWYSFARCYSDQELTVTGTDLKGCNSDNYCVMDSSDCSSTHTAHSGLTEDTVKNFKCNFIQATESLTCRWAMESAGITRNTLILSSIYGFRFCEHILFGATMLNITLKMWNPMTKEERLSGPYPAHLESLVKASRPVVEEVVPSHRSLNVTWTTADPHPVACKIRHKPNSTDLWTEISEFTPVHHGNKRMHVIDSLQPVTLYTVSVSCVVQDGEWSDWSKECSGMTLESAPSSPPRVCYHTEDFSSPGTQKILLLWMAIPSANAHGTILGYKVSYMPSNHPHLKRTVTTSNLKATLEVMRTVYDINVTAYNKAGESPAQCLSILAGSHYNVTSVRGLWVQSKGGRLWAQWYGDSAGLAAEFALERVAESHPNDTHWTWIEGSGHVRTALTGDIEPKQTYNISVYPIFGGECGPPSSLQANLESGALLDVAEVRVAMVTKQQALIKWQWQRKQHQTNIHQYSLTLQTDSGAQSITVTPDMSQHLFSSLKANTKYSVHLFAKTRDRNASIYTLDFTTPWLDQQEETAVTINVLAPLIILILTTAIFSITSRIVYRKYIILQIANPQKSVAGRWLMNFQAETVQKVLQLEDLCHTETNELQVEKMCLMPEDHVVVSSENVTHQRIDYEGSDASLTFKDHIESCPTHSNAGCVHSGTFPVITGGDKSISALTKTGGVDRIPGLPNAADVENIPLKGNIDFVKGIPVLVQDCSVNNVRTISKSNNSTESIPAKSNITDIDTIPQHFNSNSISNIPANTLVTGIIPHQPNQVSSISDPPQARADYEKSASTRSIPLTANSYVECSSTISTSDGMEDIPPQINRKSSESECPLVRAGYVAIVSALAAAADDGDHNGDLSTPARAAHADVFQPTNSQSLAKCNKHFTESLSLPASTSDDYPSYTEGVHFLDEADHVKIDPSDNLKDTSSFFSGKLDYVTNCP